MDPIFARFCVLQAAYWSFYAALPGYITAYMLERGMSTSLLGVILALFMLLSFFGSLFWGRWVDRKQANRRFFLIGTVAAVVLGTLLYFFAGAPVLLAILYPLFGFMTGPMPTTLDAWVIAAFPARADAVARSRTFATLSYAVVMLVTGQLVARVGYWIMPIAALLFLGIALVTALAQPECRKIMTDGKAGEQTDKASPKQLLRSRRYVLLVVAVFFTGMAVAPINNMKVVVFENVGGDVSFLGWDAFIGCMVQIPFLMLVSKLRRLKAEYRLLMGTGAALFYTVMVVLARSPAMIIIGTCLTNISFGVLFPTMREMTEESVGPNLRTTAHSVVDVAYGSLSGMIATAWSGRVLDLAGSVVMGSICAVIALVAMGFCLALLLIGRKTEYHAPEPIERAQ